MTKPIRRGTAAAVASATLAALAAPPAQAADPRTQFEKLSYGASYAVGYIRWHARSIDVDYSIKAHGCRLLQATTYNTGGEPLRTNESGWVCDTTDTDTRNVGADVPGGAASVVTRFWAYENGEVRLVDQNLDYRP
ncbi:MAG: hypothetical protein QOF58_2547 [Pseudonocardiales bacterium]|jgi:hypothetical protein|nr:hypothetical protein [Pseudonocardiales bacterium]